MQKKEFEKYMKKLETYAGDAETLTEIEIRVTELLAENGVEKNGVITAKEVDMLQAVLGQPEAFAQEGSEGAVDSDTEDRSVRKLYRDLDGAILGGVLSGLAIYFKTDVVWVRLIFVVLLLVSFGSISLIYALMWIIVPPALTTADKLQLAGKPVTLEALRDHSEVGAGPTRLSNILKSVFFIGSGIAGAMVALGALATTVGMTMEMVVFNNFGDFFSGPKDSVWLPWLAFGLFVASGLLLTLFASLVAVAMFKRRWTKKLGITLAVIAVSGIVVFSTGMATILWQKQIRADALQEAVKTHKGDLPDGFEGVKKLAVSAYTGANRAGSTEMRVSYVVSKGAPRYELRTPFEGRPSFTVNGSEARITLKSPGKQLSYFSYFTPELVVYGPALDEVKVEQGDFQYAVPTGEEQSKLDIATLQTASMSIFGTYDRVNITGNGRTDVSMSTVKSLSVKVETGTTQVSAGTVNALEINLPSACPAHDVQATIEVRGVSTGEFTYNGKTKTVGYFEMPCGVISFGESEGEA